MKWILFVSLITLPAFAATQFECEFSHGGAKAVLKGSMHGNLLKLTSIDDQINNEKYDTQTLNDLGANITALKTTSTGHYKAAFEVNGDQNWQHNFTLYFSETPTTGKMDANLAYLYADEYDTTHSSYSAGFCEFK